MSDEIENYSGEESDYSDDDSDRDDDDDEEKVIPTIASKLKKPILANISDELDDDGGNPEDDIVLDDDAGEVPPMDYQRGFTGSGSKFDMEIIDFTETNPFGEIN